MTVFAKGAHYGLRDLCETDYDVIGLLDEDRVFALLSASLVL